MEQCEKPEQLTVNQINAVEFGNNKFEPAGKWISDGKGKDGPTTAMIPEGNAWYSHTFSPSRVADDKGGMVPWFNLIVSRQGGNVGSKANDTQSLEFFNVWYFDESDRNIYVEILESPLYYYKGHDWNGKELLENRLIAYANSKQTVYYTKLKGKMMILWHHHLPLQAPALVLLVYPMAMAGGVLK